uniref:Peptidase A1 domain-containing protein n=1 Tax=Brassica oleracea var. oleracea TaxID=109376 RepID=A0A0D3B7I4_BRAOL
MARLGMNMIHVLCVIIFAITNTSHSLHEKPQAFLQPIRKDITTNLYYSPLSIGANVHNINLAIDLGGSAPLLLTCAAAAKSRSYHPIKCGSSRCIQAKPDPVSCPTNTSKKATCHKSFSTSFTEQPVKARLLRDTVSLLYTDNGFTYMGGGIDMTMTIACTDVKPFPSIVVGTLGLAKTHMALPSQIVSLYKLPFKVALCLPSPNSGESSGSGSLFIGGGPYFMALYPEDISKIFASTPLLPSDQSRGEYFIDVNYIQISGKIVPFFKKSTKICTLAPYTVLHSSIYKALVLAFAEKAKMTKVPAVKPFASCFSSKRLGRWMMGSRVPVIELLLRGGAKWKIYGSNSLVKVSEDVVCLGFMDGGVNLTMGMIIGVLGGGNEYDSAAVLNGHTQDVKMVQWHPTMDVLFSCSYDNTIKVWWPEDDDGDYRCVQTLDESNNGHSSTVRAILFNAAGDKMVTCSDDLTLKIWEPDISMMHSGLIFVHTLVIMTVPYTQLTGLGMTLLRVEQVMMLYDCLWTATMTAAGPSYNLLLKKEKTHDMDVNSVQWSPCEENRLLASVSDDGMVKIWQLATKP